MFSRAKSVLVFFTLTLLWSAPAPAVVADGDGLPAPNEFVPLDVFPEMTHREQPEYPAFAKKAGLAGSVMVQALVGEDGKVLKAQVAKSSGFRTLDEAALKAAKECRYTPGVFDDEPVAAWVTYEVKFVLERPSQVRPPSDADDSGQ